MPDYILQISIQGQMALRQLSQQDFKICFASAIADEGFKVIASSMHLGSYVQFQWNDDFAIAASQSEFMNGVQFSAATDATPIRLGQSYNLTPDWRGGVGEGGPRDGLRFNNQADRASAIVYRNINGSRAPIYFSSQQLPRGAIQEIRPINKVAVWFQRDGQTGTMIDGPGDLSIEIDMSGRTSARVVFNDDMSWSLQ
ncbi:hypothetical protein BKA59DRAFT_168397 [Fusarium tricinctum]|uniref:Uncharacterized protein n=1 Tax=Fusarium tricinctum TaxID=61284 RepID=A0A8K0WE39_9HYPO|nr:hypothetical protein BKA59DRAFT_168397 [Fusarium tricinctum]